MEQGLPKAIQAELDAAEAIEKQIAAASQQGNTDSQPEPQPAAEPEPQPAAPEPTQLVPAQEPSDAEAEWKRRYEILQGKYNAEVPRLSEQLRGTNDLLHKMQDELKSLKTTPAPEPQKVSLVTKDDEDTFGSDMVDLQRRVSRDELSPVLQRIATIEQSLQQFIGLYQKVTNVEQQQIQTAQERFWGALNSAVPDWEQINADPRWLSWLNEYDPVAGRTRQESLDEASNKLDSKRVIGMFSLWKGAQPEPARSASASKQELSRQVAPPKQNGAASQPVADKIWTLDDYNAAFDPRLYQTIGSKEADALQAEADRALAEGRVR